MIEHLGGGNFRVQQEYSALFQGLQHVVSAQIGGIVTGYKIRSINQPGHVHRAFSKAQVTGGDSTGLLGVIHKISLGVHVGVLTDDFNAVLVGSDRTVGTQTPEHAGDYILGSDIDFFLHGDGKVGQVVIDSHGEVVGTGSVQVIINGFHIRGCEFLGGETVASADNLDSAAGQYGDNILIQGLSQRTGLFGSVQNGYLFNGFGQGGHKVPGGKGAVEPDFHGTDLLSLGKQVVDGQVNGIAGGAHGNDHVFRIGSTNVIKQVVASSCKLLHLVHVFLNNGGYGQVVFVCGFTSQEIELFARRNLPDILDIEIHHDHSLGAVRGRKDRIYG